MHAGQRGQEAIASLSAPDAVLASEVPPWSPLRLWLERLQARRCKEHDTCARMHCRLGTPLPWELWELLRWRSGQAPGAGARGWGEGACRMGKMAALPTALLCSKTGAKP
jgi:hypothetical protein